MRGVAAGLVITLSCLCACTGSGNGGSGGQGTTTTGGQITTTSASAGAGGAGTGGTATSSVCAEFADAKGLGSVTIRVHNEAGQVILVQQPPACAKGGLPNPYSITPTTGGDATVYPGRLNCQQTCGDRLTQGGHCCDCTGQLTPPYTFKVEPGKTVDLAWDGTGATWAQMPAECFFRTKDSCDTTPTTGMVACSRIDAAPAGSYEVRVMAYRACNENCLPEICMCWPPEPPAISDPVPFTFPGTPVVDVVFGPSAFAGADAGP